MTADQLECARTEQRETNLRAIRLFAQEHRVPVVRQPDLERAIAWWQLDAAAISRAHLALTRLEILIAGAGLTATAMELCERSITDARSALYRFETPLPPGDLDVATAEAVAA